MVQLVHSVLLSLSTLLVSALQAARHIHNKHKALTICQQLGVSHSVPA